VLVGIRVLEGGGHWFVGRGRRQPIE
jgi:hypothetical protein